MNEIKITTELCAEDRARIDRLTAALEGLTAGIGSVGTPYAANNVSNVVEAPKTDTEVPKDETPAEPETAPAEPETTDDETTNAKEVPEHTQAELQQKVISLVSAGNKDDVKKIIEQYAPRVSAIPAEKINEVWDKLATLEKTKQED